MQKKLKRFRRRLDGLLAEWKHLSRSVKEESDALNLAEDRITHTEQAQQILQTIAQSVQQTAHDQIAGVVSKCLEAVFDEPYEFKIIFERKRGKTEARLVFFRDGHEFDPLTASGGGVVDVAAFALRLACIALSQPQTRRLLVLDEPFAHCKPPHVLAPKINQMLMELSKQMGFQFVVIPSIEAYYRIGKVIEIK